MNQWYIFQNLLKSSFRDLLPIVVVVLFFQILILQTVPDNWQSTAIGLVVVGFGLALFLQGLEIGIFPVGDSLAKEFASHGSTLLLIGFGFLIGYGTTIAEPALLVIADKAAAISDGRIDSFWLRQVVALSVGFAISLGVFRIIVGHSIIYYIVTGYILVTSVTFFAPVEIVGLAYDLGGVTTSTITVPLVAALGIGLASSIKGRNPMIDGFGLIAFASLTPMIFVQIYGIYVYMFGEVSQVAHIAPEVVQSASAQINFSLKYMIDGLIRVIGDVIPILAVILFFHYAVLKKPIKNIGSVLLGFIFVVLGLHAFIIGLELGLFSLGESMAFQLIKSHSVYIIYSFAFAIGFATTMAEPSLIAISYKAKEVSDGEIDDFSLRIFVAIGVAFGIALGAYRIISGDGIHYYIIAGYMVVVLLTFIAPKYIVPIAFDSGGVTTSTVTVPLVAALGIGLASNIDGRNPLIDGFGLIAFASLFPMITVLSYGIIAQYKKRTPRVEIIKNTHSVVNVGHTQERMIAKLKFCAVVAILPESKKDDALLAASEKGASGVTILPAEGFGLKDFVNMYSVLLTHKNVCLMYVVPEHLADAIVENINEKLGLSKDGHGFVFSGSLNNMRGISVAPEHIKV